MDNPPPYSNATEASRIYFLPNLMTAGNLFCGFLAIMSCIEAKFTDRMLRIDSEIDLFQRTPSQLYELAVLFILAGVVFDSLDGRLARLGGRESLFGKEFDSLADIVTFGLAPALLVQFLILQPTATLPTFRLVGWFVGFTYLVCAAVRLARFNVITSPLLKPDERLPKTDFLGLPVPAAAGTIASLVMVINRLNTLDVMPKPIALALPPLLLLVAGLMVSTVHYPSFKNIGWRTEIRPRSFILLLIGAWFTYQFHYFAVAAIFLTYIFYGLVRHLRRSSAARKTPRTAGE